MARDKLITIRIEGEKREAFNQLVKSQNTDTASLLYDFISGCLDGTLDVGIVTGKKQRIDKIDNQIDTNRIDKLETTTQEIGERLDKLSQKLEDWIWVSQRSQENHLTELKDQINILAIQLDSQKDRQGENPNPNPTVENAVEPDLTIEGEDAIETWYTLNELLGCHYRNWPKSRQGLQDKADREHWPKRKRKDSTAYEYHAILP